jgi:hypothetical protein
MPILPDPANDPPLSPLPPESFLVQEAWMVAFPSLHFPSEWIGVLPHPQAVKKGVRDVQLRNGVIVIDVPNRYEIVADSDLARFRREERGLVTALKYVLDQKSDQPSQHTKHLLAAFAASHPQISVIYQELLIPLARYTFLLEVKASVEYSGKAKGIDMSFVNLKNVTNCSPCCTSLTNWVTKLARDQHLIFSSKTHDSNDFCQSDGGQKGQNVRLFSLLDEADTTESENGVICEFWADLTYTGKTSDEVAAGSNHSRQKFDPESKNPDRRRTAPLGTASRSRTPDSWRYEWSGLKLPAKIQLLKQDMEEKEAHAGGECDIGILESYKLVSLSIDQSIFED